MSVHNPHALKSPVSAAKQKRLKALRYLRDLAKSLRSTDFPANSDRHSEQTREFETTNPSTRSMWLDEEPPALAKRSGKSKILTIEPLNLKAFQEDEGDSFSSKEKKQKGRKQIDGIIERVKQIKEPIRRKKAINENPLIASLANYLGSKGAPVRGETTRGRGESYRHMD